MSYREALDLVEKNDYENLIKLGYGEWTKAGFYMYDYGLI